MRKILLQSPKLTRTDSRPEFCQAKIVACPPFFWSKMGRMAHRIRSGTLHIHPWVVGY